MDPDIDLALLIDRFMRRIHFALQARAPAFDPKGVGPGGGIVLLTLADLDCCRMQDLTERMSRDKSQMTRTIQSLERKGLVMRQTSPDDARVSLVALTAEGRAVVDTLRDVVSATIGEVLGPLSNSEEETLRRLLNRALAPHSDG